MEKERSNVKDKISKLHDGSSKQLIYYVEIASFP